LALNAVIALLAFVCLRVFSNPVHVSGDATFDSVGTYLLQATAAGFGAMALLRTSFFNVRIGDKDVGLGPGLVLQVILDATDREVDRARAQERSRFVQSTMQRVSFVKARVALPAYCIALMQNLSSADQQELGRAIDNLSKQVMGDDTLALILGLTIMTFVGGNVLERAVTALGAGITGIPAPEIKAVAPVTSQNTALFQLTINGANFRPGAAIWVGNVPCANVMVANSTSITCDVPAMPGVSGTVAITVANSDGQSATLPDKFSLT